MVWVVKFRNGAYSLGIGEKTAYQKKAMRFPYRCLALTHAGGWNDAEYAKPVRLKPRAKLDEAAIRRAERERIAQAFGSGSNATFDRIQTARANEGPLYGEICAAILALTWPEPKP